MQLKIFPTSLNAVAPAETKAESRPSDRTGRDDSPAERIRKAREILTDLLLKDELAFQNTLLVGPVAEDLNRIALELEQSAGMQQLFELWIR
jgi:hypothetical protein